ncbi:TonB-dependent receptor [Neptunitalea chrysea]|uniref:TonB-dependent receptor n=1 Tax=Neptunitalea chrysea TaxID=1647581 RepID=A0A9W6B441_9FLAO|nr:hypothetical protein [Neptunitalea chrysea]GLB51467.1 TonB-dependent receptor [Neptunitalea chrysea]
MKTYSLYIYMLLTYITIQATYAQKQVDSTLIKYENFFSTPQETLYTQINKSIYFNGEELWFKTYIYNTKQQQPYIATTNVIATLYNSVGEPILSKTFYAQNGSTHGNFLIDSTFSVGKYYLKTTTEFMKNFDNDRSYTTSFTIGVPDTKQTSDINSYDFQLLPEGGHILSDVNNTFGCKLINTHGKGIPIENAYVTDSNGKTITSFKSNEFGMGKFKLHLQPNTTYKITAKLYDDSTVTKQITNIPERGVIMNVENILENQTIVTLSTNKKTIKDLYNKVYTLLIHKEGAVTSIEIPFQKNELSYMINIPKEKLLSGINILTLLDEQGNPLLERIIYNNQKNKISGIKKLWSRKENDSIRVYFKTTQSQNINASYSVSVLPANTKAYNFNNSIISTYLLAPYVKGSIENPNYYFKNNDRKTLYDLDLLLLTQGWSSYNWDDIFNKDLQFKYPFESGFTLAGTLENPKHNANNKLVLFSNKSNLLLEIPLKEDNSFLVDRLFIKDSSDLNFTISNKSNKNKIPKINYTLSPSLKNLESLSNKQLEQLNNQNQLLNNEAIPTTKAFILKDAIALDAVTVTAEKKETPMDMPVGMFDAKHYNFKDSPNEFGFVKDIIQNYGYKVVTSSDNVLVLSRRGLTGTGQATYPTIFLDDVQITEGQGENNQLLNLRINEVTDMFISRHNVTQIANSSGGIIKIYTKKGKSTIVNKSIFNRNKFVTNTGFGEQKKYYTPKYNTTQTEAFDNFAPLNWEPDIDRTHNGSFTFRFPYYYKDVKLFIEGMDSYGNLIHEEITVNP